ncbi:MAG: LytTR family DNA-binding domain-containing protein [Flavobacteriales bacterium]|uniref:LytR/AlgR family response regulator transcription factor n=1 Tax=Sanyastnella coralliicola TaxID=3069118 RepID=UPI0027BA06B9|nr:LytTR family DNA-binding domain-containing protein [Longitalea sp. SCSIO 12813]MCH2198987.1 LytTR family DNA-binding domain-containing protein [Flavobacteriales bacterium]
MKEILRAIIIDDEQNARDNLKMMVTDFCEGIQIMGTAPDAREGKALVEALDPDLVFLDVMMPAKDGFGFLNMFNDRDFEVIFTTAHGEHALRAYKENAAQYLEKPINIEELQAAVERVRQIVNGRSASEVNVDAIAEKITEVLDEDRTPIVHSEGVSFLNSKDITHLEAQDQYTVVHLSDGRSILSSKTIKYFEERLSKRIFFRLHRSYIVNIAHHLKEYSRQEGGFVILSNDNEIPIARRKLQVFLERVNAG